MLDVLFIPMVKSKVFFLNFGHVLLFVLFINNSKPILFGLVNNKTSSAFINSYSH